MDWQCHAFNFASGATRTANEGYQKLLEDANSKKIAAGTDGAGDQLKTLKLSSQVKGSTFAETDLTQSHLRLKRKSQMQLLVNDCLSSIVLTALSKQL